MKRRDFNDPTRWGFTLDPHGDGMTFADNHRPWLTTTPNANHTGWWFKVDGRPFAEVRGPSFYSCWCVFTDSPDYHHELNRRRIAAGKPIILR